MRLTTEYELKLEPTKNVAGTDKHNAVEFLGMPGVVRREDFIYNSVSLV